MSDLPLQRPRFDVVGSHKQVNPSVAVLPTPIATAIRLLTVIPLATSVLPARSNWSSQINGFRSDTLDCAGRASRMGRLNATTKMRLISGLLVADRFIRPDINLQIYEHGPERGAGQRHRLTQTVNLGRPRVSSRWQGENSMPSRPGNLYLIAHTVLRLHTVTGLSSWLESFVQFACTDSCR